MLSRAWCTNQSLMNVIPLNGEMSTHSQVASPYNHVSVVHCLHQLALLHQQFYYHLPPLSSSLDSDSFFYIYDHCNQHVEVLEYSHRQLCHSYSFHHHYHLQLEVAESKELNVDMDWSCQWSRLKLLLRLRSNPLTISGLVMVVVAPQH